MATKRATTAGRDNSVIRSAQISVGDVTINDILQAQTDVGAPNDARVSTNNTGAPIYNPDDQQQTFPYTVTFSWTEELTTPV